ANFVKEGHRVKKSTPHDNIHRYLGVKFLEVLGSGAKQQDLQSRFPGFDREAAQQIRNLLSTMQLRHGSLKFFIPFLQLFFQFRASSRKRFLFVPIVSYAGDFLGQFAYPIVAGKIDVEVANDYKKYDQTRENSNFLLAGKSKNLR